MSASWWCVEICSVFKLPDCTFSRTKWQSISMCFVRSWNTRFAAIWRAAWLSQQRIAGFEWLTPSSFSNERSQVSSQVAFAIDLYSASADDLETVCCFFDFQEIKESPRNTQKPLTDLLLSRQPAQSESAKAFNWISELEGKKRPCPGEDLIYCRTIWAALRWGNQGLARNWLNRLTL